MRSLVALFVVLGLTLTLGPRSEALAHLPDADMSQSAAAGDRSQPIPLEFDLLGQTREALQEDHVLPEVGDRELVITVKKKGKKSRKARKGRKKDDEDDDDEDMEQEAAETADNDDDEDDADDDGDDKGKRKVRKRGLDRADEAAGEHGKHGREKARKKQRNR